MVHMSNVSLSWCTRFIGEREIVLFPFGINGTLAMEAGTGLTVLLIILQELSQIGAPSCDFRRESASFALRTEKIKRVAFFSKSCVYFVPFNSVRLSS